MQLTIALHDQRIINNGKTKYKGYKYDYWHLTKMIKKYESKMSIGVWLIIPEYNINMFTKPPP